MALKEVTTHSEQSSEYLSEVTSSGFISPAIITPSTPTPTEQASKYSNRRRKYEYEYPIKPSPINSCCHNLNTLCFGFTKSGKFRRAIITIAIFGFFANLSLILADKVQLSLLNFQFSHSGNNATQNLYSITAYFTWIMIVCRCFCAVVNLILLFHIKKTINPVCGKFFTTKYPCPFGTWFTFYILAILVHIGNIVCLAYILCYYPFSSAAAEITNSNQEDHHSSNFLLSNLIKSNWTKKAIQNTIIVMLILHSSLVVLNIWFVWIVRIYCKNLREERMNCNTENESYEDEE